MKGDTVTQTQLRTVIKKAYNDICNNNKQTNTLTHNIWKTTFKSHYRCRKIQAYKPKQHYTKYIITFKHLPPLIDKLCHTFSSTKTFNFNLFHSHSSIYPNRFFLYVHTHVYTSLMLYRIKVQNALQNLTAPMPPDAFNEFCK